MSTTTKTKKLIITIEGTDRKRRELERALRTFIDKYDNLKGVYNITVHEENTTVFAHKKVVTEK